MADSTASSDSGERRHLTAVGEQLLHSSLSAAAKKQQQQAQHHEDPINPGVDHALLQRLAHDTYGKPYESLGNEERELLGSKVMGPIRMDPKQYFAAEHDRLEARHRAATEGGVGEGAGERQHTDDPLMSDEL
jgi:hypothetical protein